MFSIGSSSHSVPLPSAAGPSNAQAGSSQKAQPQATRSVQEILKEIDKVGGMLAEAYRLHQSEEQPVNSRVPAKDELASTYLVFHRTRSALRNDIAYATVHFKEEGSNNQCSCNLTGTWADIEAIDAMDVRYKALRKELDRAKLVHTHMLFKKERADAFSFEKKGNLGEFNIHAFLNQYSDELDQSGVANFQKIPPKNPAFYLRPIRENRDIKNSLLKLSNHLQEIEKLCECIDRGEWDAIPATSQNKNAVFYAFAANRISREEFKMQLRAWNVQEQFNNSKVSQYRGKAFGTQMTLHLPQRSEQCDLVQMFHEDGELTDDGEEYLNQFVNNLATLDERYRLPRPFNRDKCFKELMNTFKELPKNLQVFYCISNKLTEAQKEQMRTFQRAGALFVYGDAHVVSQQQMTAAQMPWAAAPNNEGINALFYSPSPAIFLKFLQWINLECVQPTPCLGTVNDDTVGAAKLEGFMPSRMCDEQAKSNDLTPHGYPMGVLDGEMHDEFHCMAATLHSGTQKHLCCKVFPDAIRNVISPQNNFLDQFSEEEKMKIINFANRMKGHLIDMAEMSPSQTPNPFFFAIAFKYAHRKLPAADDSPAMRKAYLHLLKECVERAKQYRTGNVAAPTLAQRYDWSYFESMNA